MDSNFLNDALDWDMSNSELFSPSNFPEVDMQSPDFGNNAAQLDQPSTILPEPVPEPENGQNTDSSLSEALDVNSPSQFLTTPPRHSPPRPQEFLVDSSFPVAEQAALPPATQPNGNTYHPPCPNNGPPYGNWHTTLPNGQPLYNNGNPPYNQPVSQYVLTSVPRQNIQGPIHSQPEGAPMYYQPIQAMPHNDGQGTFANQTQQPIPRGAEHDRNEAGPQDMTTEDVAAEVGNDIEYVSAGGDVFKGNHVRFNHRRGHFLPLVRRRKDEVPKRSGPRPGTVDAPLYEMCMWTRGEKPTDSEALGKNTYGLVFDRPDDWELPNGLGTIRYNSEGCMPDGFTLTARQIRSYVNRNPRKLRLMVANAPSQATHRLFAKECIWKGCPNAKRSLRQGFQQIIFDEYPDQTDVGDRDPFRIAGRMHLYCYERCCDIVEDFKQGIVKPETRQLIREQKNAMALNRDCNTTVERETYEPWFRHHIQTSNGPLSARREFEQSLAYVLTEHHLLSQAKRRQAVRDSRNQARPFRDPKSLDTHRGDLWVYQQRSNAVSSNFHAALTAPDERFQPSLGHPDYRLPDYFGSKAIGHGFVLDQSLIHPPPNPVRRSRRKRVRAEITSGGDEGDNSVSDNNHGDEHPQRPIKRARTAASSTTPSPSRKRSHAEITPNEGEEDSPLSKSTHNDEISGRPIKRARAAASPVISSSSRKRSHTQITPQDGEEDNSLSDNMNADESSRRPVKRACAAASPATSSSSRKRSHAEITPDEGEENDLLSNNMNNDGGSQRPMERARAAASPATSSSSRKRSHAEATSNGVEEAGSLFGDDVGDLDSLFGDDIEENDPLFGGDIEEEDSERPAKRARTSASPTNAPSPDHNHATRSNPQSLILPGAYAPQGE